MKKLLLSVGLVLTSMSMSAQTVTYFFEDFEWIKPWADTPWTSEAKIAGCTVETSEPSTYSPNANKIVQIDGVDVNLADVFTQKGYEFPVTNNPKDKKGKILSARPFEEQIYLQKYYLKFGLTDYYTGITLPPINELGDGMDNLTLTFDWCPMIKTGKTIDATELCVVVKKGDTEKTYAIPAHDIAEGGPLKWIPATVEFTDVKISKDTKITIRNTDSQFPGGSGNAYRYFLDNIKLTGDTPTAVSDLSNESAPVEYFNLQGVKVANPEGGVFIRRQGSSVTKVVK